MTRNLHTTKKDISWLIHTPIAHRGLHDISRQIPENSIPAFIGAIERGFTIELDIRRTADNHIVVYHDSNVLRLTGSKQEIDALPFQFVQNLRIHNTEYRIPLFTDVLATVAGKVPILIDIKTEKTAGAFETKIFEILRTYPGKFAIESFNPHTLQWFKTNAPGILRGRVAYDHHAEHFRFLRRYLVGRYLKDNAGSPDFLAYDIRCRPYWTVQFHRKRGAVILGWTAKNEKQMEICRKYFDNLLFEGFLPEKA